MSILNSCDGGGGGGGDVAKMLKLEVEDGDLSVGEMEEETSPPKFVDQYHVVKHILEYLRFSDLLRARLVNVQWSEIGRIVRKQRRNQAFTALVHPYLPHHKLAFEYFNGYEVSEEATSLVQSGQEGYHPYRQRGYPKQRFGDLITRAREVMRRSVVEEAYDEPQVIVNFGTSAFDSHLVDEYNANYKKVLKERLRIIFGGIQDSIPCLTSFSCGVIASVPELSKTLEMEKGRFPVLSSLAIPKVAGLLVKPFTVTKEQDRSLKGNESVKSCKRVLGIDKDPPEPGLQLKGIMFLHKVSHRTPCVVEAILKYLRSNPQVALAGGVHESVHMSGVADEEVVAAGLLIYGSDLVRVSSVALHESKLSKRNSDKLETLKSEMIPGESSFAFMFACNGRGRHMHGRPNVESDLFNSLLPETPLVGAFTLGEYCHDPSQNVGGDAADGDGGKKKKKKKKKMVTPKRIDYAYTTVFLLISYRHRKTEGQQKDTTPSASSSKSS